MEQEAPKDLDALSALPATAKHALLAWCTAHALEQQLSNDVSASPVIEVAARRMNVDVAACLRPTAANYWTRVKKGHALETARQLIGDRWADDKAGERKADIAVSMEAAFSEDASTRTGLTADTARRTAAWLPDGMGLSGLADEAADAEADNLAEAEADLETDDTASDGDQAGDLPAFLTEAAE